MRKQRCFDGSEEDLFRRTRTQFLVWSVLAVLVVVVVVSASTYIFLSINFETEINDSLTRAGMNIADNISRSAPVDSLSRFIPDLAAVSGRGTDNTSTTPFPAEERGAMPVAQMDCTPDPHGDDTSACTATPDPFPDTPLIAPATNTPTDIQTDTPVAPTGTPTPAVTPSDTPQPSPVTGCTPAQGDGTPTSCTSTPAPPTDTPSNTPPLPTDTPILTPATDSPTPIPSTDTPTPAPIATDSPTLAPVATDTPTLAVTTAPATVAPVSPATPTVAPATATPVPPTATPSATVTHTHKPAPPANRVPPPTIPLPVALPVPPVSPLPDVLPTEVPPTVMPSSATVPPLSPTGATFVTATPFPSPIQTPAPKIATLRADAPPTTGQASHTDLSPTAVSTTAPDSTATLVPLLTALPVTPGPAALKVSGLVGNDPVYTYAEPTNPTVKEVSYQIFTLDPATLMRGSLIYVSNDLGPIAIDPDRIHGLLDSLRAHPLTARSQVQTAQGAIFDTVQNGIPMRVLPIVMRIPATSAVGSHTGRLSMVGDDHNTHETAVDDTRLILVARLMDYHRQQLTLLLTCTLVVGIFGLILAAVGGWVLTRRAMRPIGTAFARQRQFVADASHEFRTPLAIIRANAETVLRHPDRSIKSQSAFVHDIVAEVDYLNQMVGDMLFLARSDMGQVELQTATIDLTALTYAMQRQVTPLAQERGLICVIEPPAMPILVQGDITRLRQMLLILLDNALKYTPGGGAVGVHMSAPGGTGSLAEAGLANMEISAAAWPGHTFGMPVAGPSVTISIFDTGRGIAPDHLAHIFDRFYRVDPSRERDAGGVGLGLAIARWIVVAHHGSIAVHSTVGKGSVFRITLPLASAHERDEQGQRFFQGMPADA